MTDKRFAYLLPVSWMVGGHPQSSKETAGGGIEGSAGFEGRCSREDSFSLGEMEGTETHYSEHLFG